MLDRMTICIHSFHFEHFDWSLPFHSNQIPWWYRNEWNEKWWERKKENKSSSYFFFSQCVDLALLMLLLVFSDAVEPSNLNSPIKLPSIYFTLRSTFHRFPFSSWCLHFCVFVCVCVCVIHWFSVLFLFFIGIVPSASLMVMMPTLAVTFQQQQICYENFNATDFISLSFSLLHHFFSIFFFFFFCSFTFRFCVCVNFSFVYFGLVCLYMRSLQFKST